MDENITKFSGQHDVYPSGGRRDASAGRGAYELLNPIVIRRDAELYERGAAHHGDRNWEKGIPSSRAMQSLLRHAFMHLEGHRDEDHIAAVRFNAAIIIYNEEMARRGLLPDELNDLPNYLNESDHEAES